MDRSIQEILSKSLYSSGASLLTKRTLHELLKFNRDFEDTVEWRDQMIAISDSIYDLGKGLSVIHGVCLAIIEDHWEDLDLEWRKMYQNDFLTFVWKKYNRKPNTVRADLRAIRVFILDNDVAKPFGVIKVPKRDECGEIVRNDVGEVITQEVEWDPLKSTLPKLKAAVPLVEQGAMTKDTWSMMYDDKISSSKMIEAIYEVSDSSNPPPQLGIKFRMEGPILVAYENGNQEIDLGELDWSGYYEEPYSLKHRALDKMIDLLGMTLDENVTLYRSREEDNDAYYKPEV